MTRAACFIGRILAALGAAFMVGTLILTVVSLANVDDCQEADCDDVAFSDALERAAVLLPISVFVGSGGVAFVNDTYRDV